MPKPKKKVIKNTISEEEKEERERKLARKRQRLKRARLIGEESEDEELGKRNRVGSRSYNTLNKNSEEISVEMEIKEERVTSDEDENKSEVEPESEILPGPKGQVLYYDAVGYYYTKLHEDGSTRWLQCSHGDCSVMSKMARRDKAPIHLVHPTAQHDHPPNPSRRDRIMFLYSIKIRHANENTPFSVIFQQESYKNPVGASFFSLDKIQAHLQKKISQGGSEIVTRESVLSAASKLSEITGSRTSVTEEPVTKKRKTARNSFPSEKLSKKVEPMKSPNNYSFSESRTSEIAPTPKSPSKASERLSGAQPPPYFYYDVRHGHFYKPLAKSGNTRRLSCTVEGCPARAVMTLDDNAPISLEVDSPPHNHSLKANTPTTVSSDSTTVSSAPTTVSSLPAGASLLRSVRLSSSKGQTTQNKVVMVKPGGPEPSEIQEAGTDNVSVILNKVPEPQMKRYSEKLEGPEYYYDFRGHYYFTTRVDPKRRYLRCLFPSCLAQAFMKPGDNAEILPLEGSRPHNHKPEFDSKYFKKIKQWEDQLTDLLPSERLPSFRYQYCCYHDGRGFYYHQISQVDNIRYLACAEPKCPVKAHMCTKKDAPITISGLRMGHNHGPDHTRRDALLFIDAVRVRTRSGTDRATAVALEVARNPVGAARVNLEYLEACLEQAAKIANNEANEGITEDEVDYERCLKSAGSVTQKPSTESQVSVHNHFSSAKPILDDDLRKNNDESQQEEETHEKTVSELVPALLSDSWLYHDGCGYYYNTTSINQGCRYLQCVVPKCGVQACVWRPGGLVKPCRPHNHGPQPPKYRDELWFFHRIKTQAQKNPDTPLAQIYSAVAHKFPGGETLMTEPEIFQLMNKFVISVIQDTEKAKSVNVKTSVNIPGPSTAEELPNTTAGRCQYHDGQGYYYTIDENHPNKQPNTTHLTCISQAGCPARATLVGGEVRIKGNMRHNHKPDQVHRQMCLFSDTLKKRFRDENTSLAEIYMKAARKYPKAAAILREDRLREKFTSIRRYVRKELNLQDELEELEDCSNTVDRPSDLASEEFLGMGREKAVYHDGRGFFYQESFINGHFRYLMCCEPHCLAQAKMGLTSGAPVVKEAGALRHCHPPDPLRRNCLQLLHIICQRAMQQNAGFETVYQQETAKEPMIAAQLPKKFILQLISSVRFAHLAEKNEDLWTVSEQCERIPTEQGWVYHVGRGYYFYYHDVDKSQTRSLLRCCEDGCEARVLLEGDRVTRAPGSVMHNHGPEPRRRSTLLLLHRVGLRSQLDHCSISDIYNQEASRSSEFASLIPKNKLNETLQSLTAKKYFKELEEEDLCLKEHTIEDNLGDKKSMLTAPYEILYSAGSGKPVYFDKEGYYFTELWKGFDKQCLKCIMPFCEARAYILSSDERTLCIPKSWAKHNHNPDRLYCSKLRFIHNLRQRVLKEDTSLDVIYSEECEREPLGADLVNEASAINLMHKLRKSKTIGDDFEFFIEEFLDYTPDLVSDKVLEKESVEKVSEVHTQSQKKNYQNNKKMGQQEDLSNGNYKPASAYIKTESSEPAKDEPDEYTEPEYLEEERLEEESIDDPSMEDDGMQIGEILLPSEKLPSISDKGSEATIYHDGKGYYFQCTSTRDNTMYMKCIEQKCRVLGKKAADKECDPIIPVKTFHGGKQVFHNHPPDFDRRTRMFFVHRCMVRAATEPNLSINQIWKAEVAKDRKTASQYSAHSVQVQMLRYRKEHAANSNKLSSGTEESQETNFQDTTTPLYTSVIDRLIQNESEDGDVHNGAVPEKIPSLVGAMLWHAAGYFYSTRNIGKSVEYVDCVEKDCTARAQVMLGHRQQPVSIKLDGDTPHCHVADPLRRNQLLFIDRCKRRAATTLQSVDEIFYDEACRAPEVASQLSAVRVKRAMGVAKKEKLKTGSRPEPKESEDSKSSGDHGMSELGEMANVTTVAVTAEEAGSGAWYGGCGDGQDDSEDYYPEERLDEDTDDVSPVNPKILTHAERTDRKKELAKDRQRRRQVRMSEDSERWDQLENEKQRTRQRRAQQAAEDNREVKPKLGPKFMKELMKSEEEEYLESEELVDETYSDYVTLEDEDSNDVKVGAGAVGSRASRSQKQYSRLGTNRSEHNGENENDHLHSENRTKQSEVLPGYRPKWSIYHDLKGYYYIFNTVRENKRYVKCIEPLCRVRGSMQLYDGAPIRTTPNILHNHRPDFQRKNFVLFLQACKERAVNETLPLTKIYKEECSKDPVSAGMISSSNMLQRMQRARKQAVQYYPTDEDQNEFAEACKSNTITTEIPPHELVEEHVEDQDEDYEPIESETDTDESQRGKEVNKSEEITKKYYRRRRSQLANSETYEDGSMEGGPVPADELLPSEVLPGVRNSTMYHDGRGYYYFFNAKGNNISYMMCVEPTCRVRALMEEKEGSPIIQAPGTIHNHPPDYKRKQFVLWFDRAKHRAITEDLPIATIYAQEAARDPESASMIPQDNAKVKLYRARKSFGNKNKLPSGVNVSADEDNEATEDNETAVMSTDCEIDQVQDNDAVFAIQSDETQNSNELYYYESPKTIQRHDPTYVDERGFCYQQTTVRNNTRFLKCVEAGCKARASMGLVDDLITLTSGSQHNHTAGQSQLAMLMDSVGSDSASAQVIYTEQPDGEQLVECQISEEVERPRRPYKQRHKPQLTIDPEEPPMDIESDVAGGDPAEQDYYHNEDQQKYPFKPSEVIPGLRPDANNYHDGNGFYYELNRVSPNIRYLKCLIKDCKARAYMELGKENAPIIQTNFARHNHGPDLRRKQFTVFLHRVTRRAAEEDTPLHLIYQQEVDRDPQSASQIKMENVKQRMMRARRKYRQSKTTMQYEALAFSEVDMDGSIYHFFLEDEKPESIHHDEREEEGEEKWEAEYEEEGVAKEEREVREEEEENKEVVGEEMEMEEVDREIVEDYEGEGLMYEDYVISEVEVESHQHLE